MAPGDFDAYSNSFCSRMGSAYMSDLGKRGIASLCIGGGEATAVAVELV